MPKKKKVRPLPASVFDALQLSAEAHGGIGAGRWYDAATLPPSFWASLIRAAPESAAPYCYVGHIEFLRGVSQYAISREEYGITTRQNDRAVAAINKRMGRPVHTRVSFEEWAKELNVVRVEECNDSPADQWPNEVPSNA